MLLVGAIYLLTTYAEMVGFGVDQVARLTGDTAPFTTLANEYAPWLKVLVGLAGVSSTARRRPPRSRHPQRRDHRQHGLRCRRHAAGRRLGRALPGLRLPRQPAHAGDHPRLHPHQRCLHLVLRDRREDQATSAAARRPAGPGHGGHAYPIYGLVWPVPAAPYSAFPYLVLVAIAASAGVARAIGKKRPKALARAGAVLAAAGPEATPDDRR